MLSGIIVPLCIAIAVGLILLYVRHRKTRTIRGQRDLAVRHERVQQRHGY